LPFTLVSGASKSFNVVFAPATAGTPTGTLAVTSDASNPSLTVSLSGTAAAVGTLTATTSPLSFGSVTAGQSKTLSETITNSGGSTVTVSQATATGTGYSVNGVTLPFTLASGASKSFNVVFAPTTAGTPTGTLTVTSDASNPSLTVSLSGTATTSGTLTATTSPLSFGSVTVNQSKALSETITNPGGSAITVSQATATGTGYSLNGLTLPLTLAAGASKSFNVVFAPTTSGSPAGTLTVTSDAPNPSLSIPLSGTGATPGSLVAGTSPLSFGSVTVGQNKTLSETITNSGGSAVTISQATATGAGYSVNGLTLPLTLAAGASKSFNVVFAPTISGNPAGTLTVSSDASNPSLMVSLSGTATTAGTIGANPTSFSFGSVQVGNSSTKSEMLSNTGGSTITISQVTVAGAGYGISGVTVPFTINAGQSFTFSVSFTPQTSGSPIGSVSVVSTASNTLPAIGLSGTGTAVGTFGVAPTSFGFGSVTVGDGPWFWAAPFETANEFGGRGLPPSFTPDMLSARLKGGPAASSENTTLVVVATDAILTKSQAKRLAMIAQTGMARAIYPVHATTDGDVVYAAATGKKPVDPRFGLTELGMVAANTVARAIARGVHRATALPFLGALPAWGDRFG